MGYDHFMPRPFTEYTVPFQCIPKAYFYSKFDQFARVAGCQKVH